jgi:hypothetical protein
MKKRTGQEGYIEKLCSIIHCYSLVSPFTSTIGPFSWSPPNANIAVTHLAKHIYVVLYNDHLVIPPTPASETPIVRRGYPGLSDSGKPTLVKTIRFVQFFVFPLRIVTLLAYLLYYFVTIHKQLAQFLPRLPLLHSDRKLRCTSS